MSIILVIWRSLSQWNSFRNSEILDYTIGYEVSITSRMFTVWNLDEKRESTLEMMWKFHQEGKSNNFIRDYLNKNNYRPQRASEYTNKMVWNSLKKYEKRLRNKDVVTIKVESVHLLKRNG